MKQQFLKLMQLMPLLTVAACGADDCGAEAIFPVTAPSCDCDTAVGGIDELYFIPCSEVMNAANVGDVAWWTGLVTAGRLGRSGIGLGSIAKKGDTRTRVASGRPEQITSITWALRFIQRCFDKTSARSHVAKMNALIRQANRFLCIARMSDGDNTILPIGIFTTSDATWVVPETSDEVQQTELEISWKELGLPEPIDVAGLSGVLPKVA